MDYKEKSHREERRYKCTECEITHCKEHPYTCKECGKCFKTPSHLKIHMLIHSGERPHKCNECGKFFQRKETLRDHISIHTGDRRYSCTECDKCFTWPSELSKHTKTHTSDKPYCKQCRIYFSQSSELKRHMLIHIGKRTHSCDECGKTFTRKRNLQNHMRTHTGERPYSCTQCGKCFKWPCSLRKHLISHCIKRKKKSLQSFSNHDVNESEVKTVNVKTECNTSAMDDKLGIVIKVEVTDDSVHSENNVYPLNVNIVKMEAIDDQPSQIEAKTVIKLKGETSDVHAFERTEEKTSHVNRMKASKSVALNNVSDNKDTGVDVERIDLDHNYAETGTGASQIHPLNLNVVKVNTLVDEKSVMEDKPIIKVKIEGNEEHSNTCMSIVQVKEESDEAEYRTIIEPGGGQHLNDNCATMATIKVEPSNMGDINTYL